MTIAVSQDFVGGWSPALAPRRAQTLLVLLCLAAAVGGFLVTDADTAAKACAHAGGDLTRLLRAMAAIKAAMGAGVAAAVVWRLAVPATPPWLVGYGLACGAMAAGPGLIWDMVHVGAGALLLHAGLAAAAILLWRDPAVAGRLAALVASHRARLNA